jgi:fatty acid desaturase
VTTAFSAFQIATEERVSRHRHELPALCTRSTARALLGIGLDWAVIVAAAAASERVGTTAAYLVSVVVITSRINALYLNWQHEAIHGNLFPQKWPHRWLDFLYGLPLLSSVEIARSVHMSHHRSYREESLESIKAYEYAGLRADRWHDRRYRVWIWIVRPLLGYHIVTSLRDAVLDLVDHPREALRCLVFWVVVVASFAWCGRSSLILWYWLVPYLVVHPALFFWQDLSQHFSLKKSPTRDVRGWLFRALLSPHGRGAYHNVHHLFPGVPWYNLAKATALFTDDRAIDVAHGFIDLSRQILSPSATSGDR